MSDYTHTHVSFHDGSPAMMVKDREKTITLINEEGYRWTDPAWWWIEIGNETDADYQRWAEVDGNEEDDDHEPDMYWSGTGEMMNDDSYIDYLNG